MSIFGRIQIYVVLVYLQTFVTFFIEGLISIIMLLKNDHSCIFGKIEREMFWVLRVPFFSFFFPPITDFTSLEICEILRYADLLLSWFSFQFHQKQPDMIISLQDCLRIPPNTSLAHPHTLLICPLLLQLYIAEDF